jgi:hypothetical protein
MDNKLEKWLRWLKIIHDDIQQLLVKRNIFWEVQEIIKSNKELHIPSSFYDYLGDTYIAYITIGIRRQIKVSNTSVSFYRLLNELKETPTVLSRKYYIGLYNGSVVADLADKDFNKFCNHNENHISKTMVDADIKELKKAVSIIEEFTDKRIAHHDKRSPKVLPKFKEVDECIDVLDKLYKKYHLIFHASIMDTIMPTYQYDWKEIFEIPWIKRE